MPAPQLPIFQPPSPARQRGAQRLVSMAAIVFCCIFFGCAGCCVLGMLVFGPKNFDTPEGAVQVSEQITNMTVPESFVGKSANTLDNFFFRLDIARFVHKRGRGNLVLGQLHYKWMPGTEMQNQLQEFVEKLTPELKKLDLKPGESETRTVTINSAPAKFEIGSGEDRATTTRYRRVLGRFKGKLDHTIVILECEEDFLSDQEINDFINSIH